jgi:hypothetical protein
VCTPSLPPSLKLRATRRLRKGYAWGGMSFGGSKVSVGWIRVINENGRE